MSTTIDERVVEMRFDNKQFEQNVQTSLSTIDRLKRSLNLTGAAKGLEDVNAAAQKCNMTPLTSAVETVRVRFSALEVVAITALQNITNSAIAAGKNIVSAFTIDPIKSGFQEYETQINAVQTILANTSSKGTTLEQVNTALDELNHYADMTIYNFTEMTRNIGTFTAAGVDLDTSVSAIKGIANLAAVSGSNSQQASTAMYQLSQALAAGTVKLQDWNSVVNAGMGGQVFQDALKDTARVHGIAIDEMIKDEGSFRETLSKGWLTSDVLTETLAKFTGDLNESQLRTMGYTEEQIQSIIKMGQTANDAATKVKTFTQLFDTLKEAAQSGWTQSWEIIVGDFEEAKTRLTELSDVFSGLIGNSADKRNAVLEGAFGSKWDVLTKKLNTAGIETETFQNKVKELAKNHNVDLDTMIEKEGSFENALKKAFNDGTLNKSILKDAIKSLVGDLTGATKSTEEMASQMEKYGEVVERVIHGEFGTGEERIKALTEAGYDYATVQNLVNEKLGSSVRHMSSLTEEQLKNADSLASLSDEQLKNNGYTEEQITALRDLQKEAETAGSSIDELIDDFGKASGAELLWDSVLNVIYSVVDALGAVKKAWNDTFHHGMTEDEIIQERSEKLYNLIEAVNTFTERLQVTDDKADKITRTFKGLFAILDIIMTVTGGGLRLAFKGLSVVLNAFDMDILDLTANAGDLISNLRDFILHSDRVSKAIKTVANGVKNACVEVKAWIKAFAELPVVQRNISRFETAFAKTFSGLDKYFKGGIDQINDFIKRIKELDHITLDDVDDIFKDFKDNVIDYFLDIDGKFDDISNAVKEFKDDVKKNFADVGNDIDGLKKKIFDFAKSIKEKFSEHIGIGEILTIGIGGGLILFVKKIGDALETLAGPFGDLAGILSNFESMLGSCSKAINAFAMKTKSQALMNVAISIGILAASIVALTLVDQSKLWSAVGALGALSAGLLGVSAAMGIIGKIGGGKGSTSMLGIAASLLILVNVLKSMENLNSEKVWGNIAVLGVMAAGLATVAGLLGTFAPKLSKGSIALLGIAASLKIMVNALKDIDSLELNNVDRSIKILIGAMGGLVALAIICKNIKMGSAVTILATVAALKIFVGVFDEIANLDTTKMKSNMDAFVAIFGTFAILMVSSKFAGSNAAKAGVGILAMSAALLLISAALKILAKMDAGDLRKATSTIAELMVLFAGIIAVSQFAGANAVKAGAMLTLMSGALLILSGVIVILSHIKPDGLNQALKAIATLEILFAGLIAVSSLAKECKSTLVLISVTIGILAVALGTLSMINSENLAAASNALSKVMAMFALLVASSSLAKQANSTLLVLTAVVAGLGGVLYVLSGLPVESVIGVSTALSTLLLSLSASMLIISKAGTVAPSAYVTIGVMTLVVAGLAGIIGVLAYMNVGSVLEVAEGLSVLLLSLSASCLLLSAVGTTGAAAFIGVGALMTLITAVGGLMIEIGALASYYPGMEEFLNKGLGILEKVGYGLGSFFGNIVSGFAVSATSGLPEIGNNLSSFIENASPFFSGIKGLDEAAMSGVKALAETILILTAADVIRGIASWITGGSSMSKFSEELVPFGEAMRDFSIAIGDMKSEVVEQAAIAGKALAEMASTLPNSGGVLEFFVGGNDMKVFGEQLIPFGKAMVGFSEAVDGLNADTVANAATAGKAMAEMASTIPNSDGVVGFFVGENDMDKFGKQLVPFGKAIMKFSESVNGLDSNVVLNAATAGKAMAEMAATLPNSGGVLEFFVGGNDMDLFGRQLVSFGKSMKLYADAVTGLDIETVTSSTVAGKAVSELANTLPNTGGLVEWFTGKNDIGAFGTSLVSFGDNFAKYSDYMKNVDAGIVTATANAATSIVELQKSLPKEGGWFSDDMTLASFGSDMSAFGSYFNAFYNYISGVDSGQLSGIITQTNRLVDMAKGMADLDTSGMSGFSAALAKLGQAGINDFISAFDNAKGRVTTAATTMIKTFVNAVNAQKSNLTTTFTNLVQAIITAINGKQVLFNTAGNTLMVKFIAGVKSQDSNTRTSFVNIVSGCLTIINNKQSLFNTAGVNLMIKLISGVKSKDSEAKTAFVNILSGCLTAISNKHHEFQNAGQECMVRFISGVKSKDSDVRTVFTSGIGEAVKAIKDYYEQFYKAGAYLVEGFAEGISKTTYKAEAKSAAMAKAAAEAAKKELDEHSPSKVFEEIGEYAGEGFVDGLEEYEDDAEDAGGDIGEAAYSGLLESVEDGGEQVNNAIEKNNQEALSENSDYWGKLIHIVEECSEKKNIIEASSVKESQKAAEETSSLHDAQIAEEEQYWANLLETKKKGEDAEKYRSMSMVEFRKDVLSQTIEILKTYTDALQSNTEALMDDASLFQDVASSADLTKNLQKQIAEIEEYGRVMESLNSRIADGGLKDAINQMGVESLDELKIINGMTDEELNNYVGLYEQKYALCQQTAAYQLQGLQTETEEKLSALYGGAEVNLQQFAQSFDGTFESIRGYVGESIAIGSQLASGVAEGIAAGTEESKQAAVQMITDTEEAAKEAADINSPSGLFRDQVGKNITAGIAEGMVDGEAISQVKTSADEVNNSALESFSESKEKFLHAGEEIIESYREGINQSTGSLTNQCTESMSSALSTMQTVITNSKPKFQSDASSIMTSFIAGIKSQDTNARTTFSNIISGCLTAINNKQPQFNTAGVNLMIKLIAGVRSKDSETRSAFVNILSGCLTAIANKYYEFQNAGQQCMVKFIAGVKSKESEAKDAFASGIGAAIAAIREYYNQFHEAGAYLVDGFASGISENSYKAEAKARAMARAAAEAAEDELDEHSPSRVGYRIGDYFGVAFVNAIADYADKAYDAGTEIARSAKTGLSNAVSRIRDMVDGSIDTQPTIRPVLDLSDVETKSRRLNVLFSRTQAMSINASMKSAKEKELQNEENTSAGGNSYNFTQNNYSPKALSRVEIYRQTKNQFSAMERMVET